MKEVFEGEAAGDLLKIIKNSNENEDIFGTISHGRSMSTEEVSVYSVHDYNVCVISQRVDDPPSDDHIYITPTNWHQCTVIGRKEDIERMKRDYEIK